MDDSGSVFLCMVMLAILGGMVFLAVMLVKKSNEESRKSEMLFSQIAQQLPVEKQSIFMMQYNNVKKSGTTAILLALFLGGIGAHKFYLGQSGLGVVYLLFCWTMIPAFIAVFEAFSLSITVSKHNQKKMNELSAMLGAPPVIQSLP